MSESKKNPPDLITNDKDAVVRTVLANQRTFLAYLRTALTLFVAGISFIKFFDEVVVVAIGWLFIPAGLVTFLVGVHRYNRLRVRMRRLADHRDEPPDIN